MQLTPILLPYLLDPPGETHLYCPGALLSY